MLENTDGQSKMDNPEKLAKQATQDDVRQHNMRWSSLCTTKHK